MPLYIKDDVTAELVERLAKQRGLTKQDAVKLAVAAELERSAEAMPLRDRFARLREDHPLPPAVRNVNVEGGADTVAGDSR
ncbi:type II toxin-antitoxin system VapB family antitoxin [Methylocella tundrae]|uniref:Transcription factor n=1 Tax=Methylocella tundrae TaxID=227605 RepID=A0A4U8Z7K9_METTU|nr:type II toxin-antitoxin system VapB family antitoxin [Methylocella tundrae]WPP02788.1 type II toxin-antitoxin system VapB family antitoxin [Methylocella tundrae]VFU17583.1 conserved protein of unknown function [Methylocella tundrae]